MDFILSDRFTQFMHGLQATYTQAGQGGQFAVLEKRLREHLPALVDLCRQVYQADLPEDWAERLAKLAADYWLARPDDLRALDAVREADPLWYQSSQHVGAACYVDRFAGTLKGLGKRLDYLQELGVDYLHLMPLFRTPPGNSDGGYAVSSYREVQPSLGSMQDLKALATDLRKRGVSLALDFVFNHTASDHEWALKARQGDPFYRNYYFLFPDRSEPDRYEAHLREIFPEEHPGAFTWFEDCKAWVWTTFHTFQWDLNYRNPEVFLAMAGEMLNLANAGAEILRLDAVAFIWKEAGTGCENLNEAVKIIAAFNRLARIAAPALVFKSEAIVHPDDVARYIQPTVCQVSYNPLLMAMLWNALATREVSLLRVSMQRHFAIPPGTAWVNYLRCHDDIGWTFSDADAWSLGTNPFDHRQFLNDFYTGRFPGSFARGLAFQSNPKTGDARVSGTLAALAGLQKALKSETAVEVDLAVRRILMLYGVIITMGGIPLFYLGDELGQLNDESYLKDRDLRTDSRWAHRPWMNWETAQKRTDGSTVEGRLFQGICRLVALRKASGDLSGADLHVLDIPIPGVLGYAHGDQHLFLASFTEQEQRIPAGEFAGQWRDQVTDEIIDLSSGTGLQPYQFRWLMRC